MLKHVRLELARCRDFPEGSGDHGYQLWLPLDAEGKLDAEAWHRHRGDTQFVRFWGRGNLEQGQLVHGRRGWTLKLGVDEEDEVIFKGDQHRFLTGEYISIRERDGQLRTFQVAAIQ